MENNNEVVYEAQSEDFGGVHYYIRAIKQGRIIYIYQDKELTVLLGEINLDMPDEPIRVKGFSSRAIWHGIKKLIKCMKNNNYEDYLDFCA